MTISKFIAKTNKQHEKLMLIHQELLTLSQQQKDTKHKFLEALEVMLEFSSDHFYTEEQLMKYAGYPHIDSHKQAHAFFSTNIGVLISNFVNALPHSEEKILKFLDNWINQHLLTEDKKLEIFLEL